MIKLDISKGRVEDIRTALYPVRGLFHLLHHPGKYAGPILVSILKVIATSTVTIIPLLRYGYGPQQNLLSKIYQHMLEPKTSASFASAVATATAAVLCSVEVATLTVQLGLYFVGSIQDRLFDSILRERGGLPSSENTAGISEKVGGPAHNTDDLRDHVFLSPRSVAIVAAQLEDSWSSFLLRPTIFILTLPLNIVPVIGPATFIGIQALFRTGEAHKRYFNLYHWSKAQIHRRIDARFWQYYRFGLMATVLEMIPFAGYVFMYTNQMGAAMWAMDLHEQKLLEPKDD
ncbi:hypothetical protein G6F57_002038 [Rhizopus arrhizus]|uniref:Outer spore wall protein RRT8 n=1 Tax=Rhizopus oryzae TaxID=64495 RepID=A0A9P6XFX5_RHIOR|nr:hypothetical protein G6F23_003656 [Rhizopus arrhizus]KAG1424060.1 hypothetical protein G6F58_002566 [Rhizopus delemar]KAG0770664.1 hypothetical protein G6F24_000021 [Rhizopus arrhizus]KAG0773983.1 hypothetical protein G6F22_014429 [Rhizopus arrhizus]KAG0797549.1 hypothetical protein G6F21_000445 [Rhizopus arrhizus]